MGKVKDITGQVFGRLTVIAPAPTPEGKKTTNQLWRCLCKCGAEVIVRGSRLRSGYTKSCGCWQKEVSTKHGMAGTRLYKIYNNMKARCNNHNDKNYKYYGAREIVVCNEWLDKENGFQNFAEWSLANGYADNLSIDRIDNDRGYSPLNCRWVDMSVQCYNRRPRSNKTGHTGICKSQNGKYQAYITKNNKSHYLGTFSTLEEAVETRERAESELYPEGVKKNKNNKVR